MLGSGEAASAAVPLPVPVPRGTRLPFAASFYFQMSRMCGSTFLPNSSSAFISASGCSEPGVWNDRSTMPAPICSRHCFNCAASYPAPHRRRQQGGHGELPGVLPRHMPAWAAGPAAGGSDGAPGMIRAIEECLPRTARQRCLAHKVRNLQSKVPEDLWPEFNASAVRLLPGGLAGASVKDSHLSGSCRIPAA